MPKYQERSVASVEEEQPIMYRNKSGRTQGFYLPDGDKVLVLEGDTVMFPPSFGNKFLMILEVVHPEPASNEGK